MTLPRLSPLRRADLARFDWATGLWTSLGVLRRHLGALGATRAAAALVARAHRDPLRDVPAPGGWPALQDELTRHQLRPVLHMDDIAREVLGLSDDARMALLTDLVAETGARFVAGTVPQLALTRWRHADAGERERFAADVAGRLVNARVEQRSTGDAHLAFDVTGCLFVELCRSVGRPYLAPLFCEADSRHFDSPRSPLTLVRESTIARGATRCDFRFVYRPDPDDAAG